MRADKSTCTAAADGSSSRKRAPRSAGTSASDPPCACAIPMPTERPSPVPSPIGFVVKKGSKIRPATSSGMPGPSSETSTNAEPSELLDRVLRVQEEVQHDLLNLFAIRDNQRHTIGVVLLHVHEAGTEIQ